MFSSCTTIPDWGWLWLNSNESFIDKKILPNHFFKFCLIIYQLLFQNKSELLIKSYTAPGVNFINVFCAFFCTKFWRKKLPKQRLYKKRTCIMLMKLTPALFNVMGVFMSNNPEII